MKVNLLNQDNESKKAAILLFVYLVFTLVWYALTDAPWDDDCVTRYLNTKVAFSNPSYFLNLMNRPLFVLLFVLPFQLSKHGILLMAFISLASAYVLFKAVNKQGIKNAYLVIPLFLFQTYFFTISRSGLIEPLAAAIFCFGYYFYVYERFLLFAFIGSLIPLARLEMAVFWPIWAYLLFQKKQLKYIPILFISVVLWSISAYLIEGDLWYVYNKTIGKEPKANRYGQTTFSHYFKRYIYFLGPLVFYFLSLGFLESIYKRKASLFITVQFFAGFLLYVLFSWKLSLGQAAGFLRHLATLAPLAAVIALYGYNCFLSEVVRKQDDPKKRWSFSSFRLISYSIIILVLVYFYMSVDIEQQHVLLESKNYLNFYAIACIVILFILIKQFLRKGQIILIRSLNVLLCISVILIAVYIEYPDSHSSEERVAMSRVTKKFTKKEFKNYDLYVNHNWFHWKNGSDHIDERYQIITQESLNKAKDSSIIIWDSHYSNKYAGDVDQDYLINNPNFINLYGVYTLDKKFIVMVFQKINSGLPQDNIKLFNRLINMDKEDSYSYLFRGNYFDYGLNDDASALKDFNKAIEIDPNYVDALFNKGVLLVKASKFEEAISLFKKMILLDPLNHQAAYNIAVSYINRKDLSSALKYYKMTIEINKDYALGYFGIGLVYENQRKFQLAISSFTKAIQVDPNNKDFYFRRGIAYSKLNKMNLACEDIKMSFKLGNKNAREIIDKHCK